MDQLGVSLRYSEGEMAMIRASRRASDSRAHKSAARSVLSWRSKLTGGVAFVFGTG